MVLRALLKLLSSLIGVLAACVTFEKVLLITFAKTVKPPFWVSRLDELLARLKKNWLVALFGSLPSFAMATVPTTLEAPNSFCTGGSVVTAVTVGVGLALNVKPPPWRTKPEARRWKMSLLNRPLFT